MFLMSGLYFLSSWYNQKNMANHEFHELSNIPEGAYLIVFNRPEKDAASLPSHEAFNDLVQETQRYKQALVIWLEEKGLVGKVRIIETDQFAVFGFALAHCTPNSVGELYTYPDIKAIISPELLNRGYDPRLFIAALDFRKK